VGGSAITGYVATAKKTSDGTTISGTGSSSPVTISGLTTGDAYTVTVAAVNSFGLGVSSAASNSVTPLGQELYSWGSNGSGQLGQNNTTSLSSPVQVGAQNDWQLTMNGDNSNPFSAAIKINGTLWSWGNNGQGQLGQGNTTSRSSPVQVGALTNWYEVAGGNAFCLAVKTDGTLWSWGTNGSGQLGQSTAYYASTNSPVQIGSLTGWAQVAAQPNSSFAIKTNGTMWAWGSNNDGKLGLSSMTYHSSPVQIGALTNWSQISAGNKFCAAIKTDGTLWTWGGNNNGQLGQNNTTYRSSPVQVGALTDWFKVSAGYSHCVAVKTDGTLWTWGPAQSGQIGKNNAVSYSSPVQVGALADWANVTAGYQSCFAIKTTGSLWSWGRNNEGQLGQNDTANRSSPVQVGAINTWAHLPRMPMARQVLAIKG
jgi:alpha-tubulin suppressor-like RCC1 family protein